MLKNTHSAPVREWRSYPFRRRVRREGMRRSHGRGPAHSVHRLFLARDLASWAPERPRESLTYTTAPTPTHMRSDTRVRSDQAGNENAHPTGRERRVTTLTVTLAERPQARQARSQTHTQRLASRQQAWEL